MSVHQYTVSLRGSDIDSILRDDVLHVPWNNADFQLWNSEQQVPYTLSAVQQSIVALKAMTFAQWQASVTAAQKDRILFELVQRALKYEVV